jgi:hypothetical protein
MADFNAGTLAGQSVLGYAASASDNVSRGYLPKLLLDVRDHDMMPRRLLQGERIRAVTMNRAAQCHIGIWACRIGVVLMILAAVGGHGGPAETEKDCNGDYAESFH